MTSPAIAAHPVEALLANNIAGGLGSNLRAFLRFYGERDVHELQALDVRSSSTRWADNLFAHSSTVDGVVRLAEQQEAKGNATALYLVLNPIVPAVSTRSAIEQWHVQKKGESTTDGDIIARASLYLDFDAKRPKGTSATSAQVDAVAAVASRAYDHLCTILEGDAAIGYGHSGNGRAIFLALADLPHAETLALIREILACSSALWSIPGSVEIDPVVHDAKRLCPAFGTTKRKGAPGIEAHPHRRTGFVCAEQVRRLTLPDLAMVAATLRDELTPEQTAIADAALGKKPPRPTATATATTTRSRPPTEDPFTLAKAVPIGDVLSWLGLLEGDRPVCCACGLSDSGVAIVGNGLKCSHARCSDKGVRDGFRTTIDVVIEARNLTPIEAVRALGERFGFEVAAARAHGEQQSDVMPDEEFFDEPHERAPHPANETQQATPPAIALPTSYGPADVVEAWKVEKSLPRIATGFATLDHACRGGLAFPWRVVIVGPPSGGKTFTAMVIADRMLLGDARTHVAILAIDEEPEDLQVRLAQMAGFSVADCESRDPLTLDLIAERLREKLGDRLRMYGPEWSIEGAAADFAKRTPTDARRLLVVDSIQTSHSDATPPDASEREVIAANVKAIRVVGRAHGMLTIATSESNRPQYSNAASAATANRMAAGMGSGKIEYMAQTLIFVGSIKNFGDHVRVEVPKNRRGLRGSFEFFLSVDRSHHALTECDDPTPNAEPKENRAHAKVEAAAVKVLGIVVARGGIGTKALRNAVQPLGVSNHQADAAVDLLEQSGRIVDHAIARGKTPPDHHYWAAGVTVSGCGCHQCLSALQMLGKATGGEEAHALAEDV